MRQILIIGCKAHHFGDLIAAAREDGGSRKRKQAQHNLAKWRKSSTDKQKIRLFVTRISHDC